MTLKMMPERERRPTQLRRKDAQMWGGNHENGNLKAFQCYRKYRERTSRSQEGQARGHHPGEEDGKG